MLKKKKEEMKNNERNKSKQGKYSIGGNIDRMLRRFEEKDPSFNSMSRSKLEKLESKGKHSPGIGTYSPKH